jgi:hypothetical protein
LQKTYTKNVRYFDVSFYSNWTTLQKERKIIIGRYRKKNIAEKERKKKEKASLHSFTFQKNIFFLFATKCCGSSSFRLNF